MDRPTLGVVIPTLDEAAHLPSLLDDLRELELSVEIVVVDGGSVDGTRKLARKRGVRVVSTERGRGVQLNRGAAALATDWLLFLHADVRLPVQSRRALCGWIGEGNRDRAASFRFRLDGDRRLYRLTEWGQRIRERIVGIPYGDQGLLIHRSLFEDVGGYPDLPVMEDVEIGRRLRRKKALDRLPAPLLSSPRRYEREGVVRSWIRNGSLLILHLIGLPTRILARWYGAEPTRGPHGSARPPSGILLVFAKAPRPGRVKTRLARTLGDRAAAEVYRSVGSGVLNRLRDGRYRIVVCFDPPDAEDEVREWLGGGGVELRPQSEGDLGRRMAEAFRWAFGQAERVCIVGTDTPDVSPEMVEDAFRALDRVDLVVGPSTDGGYYLLALARPQVELFREVAWSTEEVLATTLERAGLLDLRYLLLEPRTDLDTEDDLEALGLDPSVGSPSSDRLPPGNI